jgi:Fe-S-cluster containining protein
VEPAVLRFACTLCGKCCNRPPEVELSEAAALADVFVFRLMFRLYWLPSRLRDYLTPANRTPDASAIFYEKKRLFGAFATRKYPVKARRDGTAVDYTKYLVVSALTIDTRPGACVALNKNRCGIYPRRPFSCRSLPFHYSRVQASAATDLKAFVDTTGYCCDTGDAAQIVVEDGRIVAPQIAAARSEAIDLAGRDRPWGEAIVRRMSAASSANHSLPSMPQIEANAQFGATTTSMRVAWQIAADIGLIEPDECERLIELQLLAIDQELSVGACSREDRETLSEMRTEYRHHLSESSAIAVDSECPNSAPNCRH